MSNPYLDAWRNSGLDAARELAIQQGENMVVVPSTRTTKSVIANASTNVASVYDATQVQNMQNSASSMIWLIGGAALLLLWKRRK